MPDRRCWLLRACTLVIFATGAEPAPASDAGLEAALVYRFVQFSQWPAHPATRYCVSGDPEVTTALQLLVSAEATVQSVNKAQDANDCHVLYLGRSTSASAEWQTLLSKPELLAIAANTQLFNQGAVFGLIQEPRQLAFRVNLSLARQRGYQLNARMLKLAKEIY